MFRPILESRSRSWFYCPWSVDTRPERRKRSRTAAALRSKTKSIEASEYLSRTEGKMLPRVEFPARWVSGIRGPLFSHFKFLLTNVPSHCGRTVEVFPAAAAPKFAAPWIIFRDQNIRSLKTGAFQAFQT